MERKIFLYVFCSRNGSPVWVWNQSEIKQNFGGERRRLVYQIGDVVVVRDDLVVGEMYQNFWGQQKRASFAPSMAKYKGGKFEIVDFVGEYYRLDLGDHHATWSWTDEMIAGLAEPAYFESDFDVFACDIVSELMRCDDA